jgi:hypothetical protein
MKKDYLVIYTLIKYGKVIEKTQDLGKKHFYELISANKCRVL